MILNDFSSTMHRMVFVSSSQKNVTRTEENKLKTSDFISFAIGLVLKELFKLQNERSAKFGDLVICLDDKDGYWRRDFYPLYKMNRTLGSVENPINYEEVFHHMNGLIDVIDKHLPWKVIKTKTAEADDIMLALSRVYNQYENIMIHSPDKDLIQAQRNTSTVYQYSSLVNKWITAESKYENMDEWLLDHVCMGDAGDGVPRVVDHTEFSDNFIQYLKNNNCQYLTPYEFINSDLSDDARMRLMTNFSIPKTNRKGESTGVLDIYKDIKFGPAKLRKLIDKHGSIDNWLDTHPLYRKHYNRNYALVMEEGIPTDVWNNVIIDYKEAKTDYNEKEFLDFLTKYGLESMINDVPVLFRKSQTLTLDDFDW